MQKHTVNLVRNLPAQGCEVHLYYVPDANYPTSKVVKSELFGTAPGVSVKPVEFRKLPYFPGHHYPDCFWASRAYHKALKSSEVEYNFVYAQGYMGWASTAARRVNPTQGPPVGVNFHGIEALQDPQDFVTTLKNCFAPLWIKRNMRDADCVLSLGGALDALTEGVGIPADRILSSCNGISSEWFDHPAGSEDDVRKLLFVGRDSERKGFVELAEVLPGILRDYSCEIHFAGNISEDKKIRHEQVTYHGMVRSEEALRAIYRNCDVLMCPSHSEGMPTVILEAAACRLPSIATDVGAVRLVVNNETGWLIPPRNTKALDCAIREALEVDLSGRAAAAEAVARTFQWNKVAERTVESISEFLRRHSAGKAA
jgi:glycosyltransferase involved in cell wall biosynthesis